jgi:hypothetical protein
MSQKTKNKRNKEAAHRKREAENILSEMSMSLDDDLFSIGIIFEHIGLSQLSYCAINSIEKINERYVGLDINIFIQNISPIRNEILCPIFHVKDIAGWNRPIISTNLVTTIDAMNSQSNQIYYYAYDLDFINNFKIEPSIIDRTLKDKRVRVITRSQIYKQIIENEFGIKVLEDILIDLDIIKMAKIIIERKKNGTVKNE